jgi:hypothetical protein
MEEETKMLKKQVLALEVENKALRDKLCAECLIKQTLSERRQAALATVKRQYDRQNGNMPTVSGYDEIDG